MRSAIDKACTQSILAMIPASTANRLLAPIRGRLFVCGPPLLRSNGVFDAGHRAPDPWQFFWVSWADASVGSGCQKPAIVFPCCGVLIYAQLWK